ncbi:MAG TPA: GTP cyclohydrolase I FolE [Gammaproteobacteria bacterium]|nr:GTP cyclohydrolase I FolE [Gammaproteobacteria bacterium]
MSQKHKAAAGAVPARLSSVVGDAEAHGEMEALVRRLLELLGEDPDREGLQQTPHRITKALTFLTSGYRETVSGVVSDALFSDTCNEMVIVKDVEFYSQCEHHMLPFFGRVHVGYLPKGTIIGLSKIARVVDVFARRLQVQERMTSQIADGLMNVLNAHGVGVVVEASHFCMMMRGVQKQNSSTLTSAMRGSFQQDARTRMEFMDLIRK